MFSATVTAENVSAEVFGDSVVTLCEISVSGFKEQNKIWTRPVAATAITSREVEQYNMVTMKDVSGITPNLYMPSYGSRMTSSIYIRGLGARIDQPVMGLNVDNVPVMNKDNFDFDLVDIERIEVLRGPQSTLFGRNTMGGVINISTLSPLQYQGVRVLAEYGRGNSWRAAVSGYRMLGHRLGMSLNAYVTSTDGFFRNSYTGNKIDHERQASVRWKTVWRPVERISVDNVFSLTVSRQGGYPYASLNTGEIAHNDTCFYRRTGLTDGLSVLWEGDNVSVASSTSLQYIDDNMTLDQDFMPLDYFTLTQKRRELALTEDVIAKGDAGNYNWLAGLFAFYRHTRMSAPVTFKEDGIDNLILGHRNEMNPDFPARWQDKSFVLDSRFRMPSMGIAVYHNSRLSVGNFEINAGLRVDHETITLKYINHASTGYDTYERMPDGSYRFHASHPLTVGGAGKLRNSFTEVLPRVSLAYRLPSMEESIVYASVSKGYKAGGFNTQMFSFVLQQDLMAQMGMSAPYDVDEIVSYKPEKSWNYEVGAHVDLLAGILRLDGAAFFIDCRDQQLTVFPAGNTTGRMMTNAGRTYSRGVEISLFAKPLDGLRLNASWGYTRATFKKFSDGISNYSGKRLPYAPSNTLFIGASYSFDLLPSGRMMSLTFAMNLRGVGDIYWDEANTVCQPFYTLLGASVELRRRNWSVQLWGENLTDRRYETFYFVSVQNAFVQRGNPWQAGVTARINLDLAQK